MAFAKLGFWARTARRIEKQKQDIVNRIRRLESIEIELTKKIARVCEEIMIESIKLGNLNCILNDVEQKADLEKNSHLSNGLILNLLS